MPELSTIEPELKLEEVLIKPEEKKTFGRVNPKIVGLIILVFFIGIGALGYGLIWRNDQTRRQDDDTKSVKLNQSDPQIYSLNDIPVSETKYMHTLWMKNENVLSNETITINKLDDFIRLNSGEIVLVRRNSEGDVILDGKWVSVDTEKGVMFINRLEQGVIVKVQNQVIIKDRNNRDVKMDKIKVGENLSIKLKVSENGDVSVYKIDIL